MLQRLIWMPYLDRFREGGPVLLRVFVGSVLIYGTQDNILYADRMVEFRDFLANHGFPYPLASAYLSVYAQFACGVLILLGLLTRWAAVIMIVNFLVALAMVHWGLPFDANIAPLSMLFGSLFLLFYGAGPISLDARLRRAQMIHRTAAPVAAERPALATARRGEPGE
jgi:putative oxidoreductase